MQAGSVKHKIVLLGDGAVGKTSLVRRFVVDQFDDQYIATIGAKVMKKDVRLTVGAADYDLTLVIWDVLGQKGFHGIQASAFDQARGVVLVFDLTRPETAGSIGEYWMPRVRASAGTIPMVLFANKVDLVENKAAAEDAAMRLANSLGCHYFLTSAKTGENVEDGFGSFARTLLEAGERKVGSVMVESQITVDIAGVADRIMTDFCREFGGVEAGTSVLNEQFKRAGLDINRPTKDGLRRAVELLAIVELSFKSENEVNKSRQRRICWIDAIEETGPGLCE